MSTINRILILGVLCALCGALACSQGEAEALDRSVLPIPEPARPVVTELDARNVTPPPRFDVKAPQGAPNVLLVLVDDLGFAGTSTFGGPVGTPTFDRLAGAGGCCRLGADLSAVSGGDAAARGGG